MDTNAIEKQLRLKIEKRIEDLAQTITYMVTKEFGNSSEFFHYKSQDGYEKFYTRIKLWEHDLTHTFKCQYMEKELKKEVQKLLDKMDLFDDK